MCPDELLSKSVLLRRPRIGLRCRQVGLQQEPRLLTFEPPVFLLITYSALGNPNIFNTISSHFAVLCSESQLLMDTFFP